MVAHFDYAYRQLACACADVSLLKDLLRVFGEAFDEVDTYQRSVPSDDYLTRLLRKQHFIAVVATKGKEVVGGLAAYELDKFEQDRREIYIYDLAVAHSHRRRGVATGMIGELKRNDHGEFPVWVRGCCRDNVGAATGVPHIAVDSLHRTKSADLGQQPTCCPSQKSASCCRLPKELPARSSYAHRLISRAVFASKVA